jgi:DNA polymerase-3 subunit gamma/tau
MQERYGSEGKDTRVFSGEAICYTISIMTTHVALYRKYRPQNFKDVVGQEQAVELLTSAIKQKKISHAYLFCGGRGTGKTTVARIVARDIGCNDEDIIEIDAASNRGIDEIRDLREAVRTAPFSSPYKVYIIDEAHMLTKEASNALLKTLEEPPSHVIFILATTDPDKLPQTIVSRCQKVVFRNPDIETLSSRLVYVAELEGTKLHDDAARRIAMHGKGSYRDALGILEQVLVSFAKIGEIAEDKIAGFLGFTEEEQLLSLLEAVCKKDQKGVISTVKKLSQGNALRAYDDLIECVRVGLLARLGEEEPKNAEIGRIAKEYPLVIGSKLVLELLENRHLLEVSDTHSWAAFEAILLGVAEG